MKRDDTDAVVVADDTAMTNVSTGVYEYSFTSPAEGLTYTAYIEVVYAGETYHYPITFAGTDYSSPEFSLFSSSAEDICTFEDAVQRLAIATQARCGVRDENILRIAVSDAYRELPHKHDWKYLKRTYQFTTTAKQSYTGASYTAATRVLSLSGSDTWPTDAAYGKVIINNNLYVVEDRIDSQNLRLQESNAPASMSGTSVIWVRNSYPIPTIRSIASVVEAATDYPLVDMSQESVSESLRWSTYPSQPIGYTVQGLGLELGKMYVELSPPPDIARTYVISGDMRPRPLRIYKDELTVNVSGTTATPTAGTFTSKHIGSVVRFSSSTTAPTGLYGNEGTFNQYVFQRVITSVSGGVATLNETADSSLTGVAAVVSDPLDIHVEVMLNYLMALASRKLGELTFKSGGGDMFIAYDREALRDAIVADNSMKSRRQILAGVYDFTALTEYPAFTGE